MPTEEQVIAVFETSAECDRCPYFVWGAYGSGGPDPCGCRVISGDIGTTLADCPGIVEQEEKL